MDDDLQERMQVYVRNIEWDLISTFPRVPASTATLDFILQLIKQEFKDELDGRVVDISFNQPTYSVEVRVGRTMAGNTTLRVHQ